MKCCSFLFGEKKSSNSSFLPPSFPPQDTILSLEPPSLVLRSPNSSSFRTTPLPLPRLRPLALLQLQASRVLSSHPIHLREPSSTLQEPSLPKTIPPRPLSLPTTACHPAPSPAQVSNPVLDTPRLQAVLAPLHPELLTLMPGTAPLTARATLSQALATGKRGSKKYSLTQAPLKPLNLHVALTVWCGCGNLVLSVAPHPNNKVKSKYNSPTLLVSVCPVQFRPHCVSIVVASVVELAACSTLSYVSVLKNEV